MADDIYIVDPVNRTAQRRHRITLSDAGIAERRDLQEWILNHPEILGESLLMITSEFAGFDRSNRRLDLLALDADANLVVIELKLEVGRTFADLQALRYAAFCSTMTMEQVLRAYAGFHGCSEEEAEVELATFLGVDELPEPSDRPRIILVAGSMDDIEITSTVLWLRNFDVDIQCIELTPFALDDRIVLVPRLVVPLPEAREYQVRVERKEATKAHKERDVWPLLPLWSAIREEYERLPSPLGPPSNPRRSYMQIRTGKGDIHYEWYSRKTDKELHVAVHFESREREVNYQLMNLLAEHAADISAAVGENLRCEEWGKKWAYAAFVLDLPDDPADAETARRAAELMSHLVQKSWPLLGDAW